jgi:hypothetical protein
MITCDILGYVAVLGLKGVSPKSLRVRGTFTFTDRRGVGNRISIK